MISLKIFFKFNGLGSFTRTWGILQAHSADLSDKSQAFFFCRENHAFFVKKQLLKA
jgi:hypothetical protein